MKALCSFKRYNSSLYKNHLLDNSLFLTLEKSEELGIPIGVDWGLISDLNVTNIENKLFCFCQFPLDKWGLDSHSVPVFYHESRGARWVFSKLDSNNKIIEIQGADRDIESIGKIEDILDSQFDDDTMETFNNLSNESIHVIKEDEKLSGIEYSEDLGEFYSESIDMERNYFGAVPYPIQNNFGVPVYNDKEVPFVGQFEFMSYDLIDIMAYLFYDPEERIVAQLIQFS